MLGTQTKQIYICRNIHTHDKYTPWCTWVMDYFIELTTCSNPRIFAALKYLLLKVKKSFELLFLLMKELVTCLCFYTSLEVQQRTCLFHQTFRPHDGERTGTVKELARVQMWLMTPFYSTITTISLLNWGMLQEVLMSLVNWASCHLFVVVGRYSGGNM